MNIPNNWLGVNKFDKKLLPYQATEHIISLQAARSSFRQPAVKVAILFNLACDLVFFPRKDSSEWPLSRKGGEPAVASFVAR
jgi:hypothetical protein